MINRRVFSLVAVLVVLLSTFAGAANQPDSEIVNAARQSLLRSIGPRASEIKITLLPARADGENEFEVEAQDGVLTVRGTSPVAICRGVYHYLRQTGTGMVTWSGSRIEVPAKWPDFPKTRIHTPYKFIQDFNVVTLGYSTTFWDWARWEKELDWMALHGFNMVLALNANEAIWQRVYSQMGLTPQELDAWFTGPAFLPWFRMGNVYGWDGPLSPAWHRNQIALQHKILARMHELGIEPVAPAFAGFVPKGLKRLYPNEKFIGMAPWGDFGGEQTSTILDPQSKLYPELGGRFIREWQKEFGPAHYFLADSFNEMQVPVPNDRAERLETLARFGRAVYDSIIAGNKDAVWVMQGWLFSNQKEFWDTDSVAALLSRVPNDRMMILDLACNYAETWRMHQAFHGKQWVFSFIPNMGGNTPWVGKMEVSATLAAKALADSKHGNLVGFGIAYEGIENNDAQTELLTDAAWQTEPVQLDQWLVSYSRARYGQALPEMVRAWKGIAATAYNHFDSNIRPQYDHRPPNSNWVWGGTPVNSPELLAATRDFLAAGDQLGNQPLYRADMIELTAQVTGARIDTLLQEALAAEKRGDKAKRQQAAAEALSLMGELDQLLAAHPTHRADRWIGFARNAGSDPAEADRYEVSAKRQITQWGPGLHLLNEYAAKQWSGITAGYYRERWKTYFDAIDHGEKPDLDGVEKRWIETVGNVSKAAPPADPLKLAREIFGRVSAPPATAATPADAPAVRGNQRVDALLNKMTLDEKIALIHGVGEDPSTDQGQAGYMPGVPRLGIPSLRLADGPPGVLTRVPSTAPTSTMGLAATFSLEDAKANGIVVAREARARGIDVVLEPFINIDRDFNYGRGYNTYGEDPLLTGLVGAAFIRGVQSQGIMSQAKHYVAYDTDGTNVFVDDQTLHEIYVAPFADAADAEVSSIMCSYNKVNGPYSCGNPETLNGILKNELGFMGFVTSDWGATHATDFINAGLDVEMSGPLPVSWSGPSYFVNGTPVPPGPPDPEDGKDAMKDGLPEEPAREPWRSTPEPRPTTDLKKLLQQGVVTEATITAAAGRVLLQMEKFGLLDGKSKHDITPSPVEENAKVNLKTAEDAAVLLKNANHALPLTASDMKSVAIIGPGGGQTVAVGLSGEKAVGLPERQIGTVEALKKIVGPAANIVYAPANDLMGTMIPAEFLSHDGKPGLERLSADGTLSQVDSQINFTKTNGRALPANSKLKWQGVLNVPETGVYRLHLQVLGCFSNMFVDGKRVARVGLNWIHGNITQAAQDDIAATADGLDNARVELNLTAGPHPISVSIKPDTSDAPAQVRLNWVTPQQQRVNYAAAIAAAKKAKTAVVFAWSRTRPTFALPGDQDKLIADVAAVNPRTIVVLNVSQPVAMPWLDKVQAVLQMWWPGDEGGWATANVLLGKKNPAGRLPFTWPRRLGDMPASDPAYPERTTKGVDGKTTFSEGIYVGYRWFDKKNIEPLFPFGFGLSYTNFAYSGVGVKRASDGGFDVSFTVINKGDVAGEDVPQVYLGAPDPAPTNAQFAVRALAAFDRISLRPGETKNVTLHVRPRQLQYWSVESKKWINAENGRIVYVGGSSRDVALKAAVK